jgi:hypothetical protein
MDLKGRPVMSAPGTTARHTRWRALLAIARRRRLVCGNCGANVTGQPTEPARHAGTTGPGWQADRGQAVVPVDPAPYAAEIRRQLGWPPPHSASQGAQHARRAERAELSCATGDRR